MGWSRPPPAIWLWHLSCRRIYLGPDNSTEKVVSGGTYICNSETWSRRRCTVLQNCPLNVQRVSFTMKTLSVLLVAMAVVVVSAMAVPVDDEAAQVLGQRSSPFGINWCGVPCAPSGYRPSVVGIAACIHCCNGECTQDSRQKWFCKC
ncbi:hypothetical protein FOCC_FOCC011785 [Frankliniella occidentalis]|nr:hypothetical protein FOCC_FOCC011785 [Frankliniella occidentalis]